jgi:hypothetical protein
MKGASILRETSGRAMDTLVLSNRQLPDGLYRPRNAVAPMRRRRLKAVAVADPRSITKEAFLALQAGLPGAPVRSARAWKTAVAGWRSRCGRFRCLMGAAPRRSWAMAMTVSAADGALVIDLAVDTSAVLAVLLQEPTCDAVLERLCGATQPAVAAPTRTEILLVALKKLD